MRRRKDLSELRRAGRLVTRVLPDGESCELVEKIGMVTAYDPETRTVEIVASDETVDRYGDIIVASGWDMTNYQKNPVILVDHSYRVSAIVGSATAKVAGKLLKATITIDGSEENVNAVMVAGLLERGLLHAVSVGFLPFAWEKITDEEGEWTYGYRYTEQELLEISWVAVPANPNAVLGLEDNRGGQAVTEKTGQGEEELALRFLAAAAAMR